MVTHMEKRRFAGRHLMLWGALGLLAWTGYEFAVRVETVWWALKGLFNLCVHEGVPFGRALTYFDPSMYRIIGFLLACVVFAVVVLGLRNRPVAGYFLLLANVAVGAYAAFVLGYVQFSLMNWLQSLKLIPLLLIAAGIIVNLVQHYARKRSGRPKFRPRGEGDRHERAPRPRKGRWEDVYENLSEDEREEEAERARALAAQVRARKAAKKNGVTA